MKKTFFLFSIFFMSCGMGDSFSGYTCSSYLNSNSWTRTSNPGGAFAGNTNLFYAVTADISGYASLLQDNPNSNKYLTIDVDISENPSIVVINAGNIILAQLSAGYLRTYVLPDTTFNLQNYNLKAQIINSTTKKNWSVPWGNFSNYMIMTFTLPNSTDFISDRSNFPIGTVTIELHDYEIK